VICDKSPNGTLIATGDDYGLVKIYRYPCLEGNRGKSYGGHSSHVPRVSFNSNGEYLLTVGGNDKALLQWKIV